MMLSTLHTVQKLNCPDLDVSRMLRELLETSGGPGVPTSLNGSLHHLCWDHSDVISVPADINSSKENNKSWLLYMVVKPLYLLMIQAKA